MSMSAESIPAKNVHPKTRSFGRAANWIVGLAAALLVLISAGGYFYHREQLHAIAADHLRLVVTGPSTVQSGVPADYLISTTTIGGQPLAAQIEVVLLGPDSTRLKAYREPANERGQLHITLPADLQLPETAKLRVIATHRSSREEVAIPLLVQLPQHITYLTTDKDVYQIGETIYCRSLTLSRYRLTPARQGTVCFEILDANGHVVAGMSKEATTEQGVASVDFPIPARRAPGQYLLVVRSDDVIFPNQSRPLLFTAQAASTDQSGKTPAVADKKDSETPAIRVVFYPEGGALLPGVENRIFFSATDASDQPIELSGIVVAERSGANSRSREVAKIETTVRGLGSFSLTPQAGEFYRLSVTNPSDITDKLLLPKVSNKQEVALTVDAVLFEEGEPIQGDLQTSQAGLPLIAAVYCRNVQVAQQPLVSKIDKTPLAISIPQEANGAMRLAVFDYSQSPPNLVAERWIYRRPSHRLNIAISGLKPSYAPGEEVSLELSVTDGEKKPTAAVLSCMAIDDRAAGLASSKMTTAASAFLFTEELLRPEAFEALKPDLSGKIDEKTPSGVALGLLLGAQAVPKNEPIAPAVFDNVGRIRADYHRTLADYQAARTQTLNTLTTASFFGGLGLVLAVAMLGLMRIVTGLHLWAPAIGAATCCLIVGAILMDPERLSVDHTTAVPFATYDVSAAELQQKAVLAEATPLTEPNQPWAATPFWMPLLVTGEDGKASLHFKLPDNPGKLRLVLDAHGDGLLDAVQAEINVNAL